MEEKLSAAHLEKVTAVLPYKCTFTVVQSPLIALECTEHTEYDLILIAGYSNCTVTAMDFLRILRA